MYPTSQKLDPITPSQERRAVLTAERTRATKRSAATRSAKTSPRITRTPLARAQSAIAAVAVLCLTGVSLLPAYAQSGFPVFSTEATAQPVSIPQSIAVGPAIEPGAIERDDFQVTRAAVEGEPFAHVASTFTNNPFSSWAWPFSVGVPISSGWGPRDCAGCSSYHQGLDLNPGEGTPIQAIGDGIVVEVGNPSGSFGVYAVIQHTYNGQMFTSLYAHMLEGSLALDVGQTVTAGTLVGQVGNTGQSTGAHLHFGIYLNGVEAIDPFPFMTELVGS